MGYYHLVRRVGWCAVVVAVVAALAITLAANDVAFARPVVSGTLKPSAPLSISGGGACTLGFVFSGADGLAKGLTAAQCGAVGASVTTGRDITVGRIRARSAGTSNVARIDIATALTVYSDVDGIGAVTGVITAQDIASVRPLLCMKGSRSGLQCGIPMQVRDGSVITFGVGSQAEDAGAPVYALTRRGQLLAAGVLLGPLEGHAEASVATAVEPLVRRWKLVIAG